MTVPQVNIGEIDGALAILPSSVKAAIAVIGTCPSGPFNTPAAFGSGKLLTAAFPRGPGPQFSAFVLQKYGTVVLYCRPNQSVAGSFLNAVASSPGTVSAITKTGTGTATYTNDGASVPAIAAQVIVLFATSGTRGTTGIVYQVSINNGSSYGPPQALGTATSFAVGQGTGVSIDISAGGTVVAGDFISFTTTAPIPASAGTVVITSPGTSAISIDGAATVDDDYQASLAFPTGGTIGVAGIMLQYSLDGGRTQSAQVALGTANTYTIPGSGGVKIDFGAGTILSGQTVTFQCVAPQWNNTDLAAAIQALARSSINWELLVVLGPLDATAAAVIDLNIDGKKHAWLGHTRNPVGAETDAAYTASVGAAFSDFETLYGEICSANFEQISAIDGAAYMRPSLFGIAALESSLSAEQDAADPNLGGLPSAEIKDALGNPKYHDERLEPGLSDFGFSVLRTWEEFKGVYPNNPLLFSPEGSDFDIMPKRRVMNIAHATMRLYFARRLAKDIFADKKTGYILESEAREIESGATKALLAALKGKVSDASVVLSRTDALLQKAPLTGEYRLEPLIYIEDANLTAGLENPALNVVGV